MSHPNLEDVAQIVRKDPDWMAKLSAAASKEAWLDLAVEAARAHGVATNAAEVDAYLSEKIKTAGQGNRELTLEELSAVSGGSAKGVEEASYF